MQTALVKAGRHRIDRTCNAGGWEGFEVLCETSLHVRRIECDEDNDNCRVDGLEKEY